MDLEQIVGSLQSTQNICRDGSLDSGLNSIRIRLRIFIFAIGKKRERIEIMQDKSAPAIERLISSLDFNQQQIQFIHIWLKYFLAIGSNIS